MERPGHGTLDDLPEPAAMPALFQSVAANLAVIVLFFAAAVLMTLGMLGLH